MTVSNLSLWTRSSSPPAGASAHSDCCPSSVMLAQPQLFSYVQPPTLQDTHAYWPQRRQSHQMNERVPSPNAPGSSPSLPPAANPQIHPSAPSQYYIHPFTGSSTTGAPFMQLGSAPNTTASSPPSPPPSNTLYVDPPAAATTHKQAVALAMHHQQKFQHHMFPILQPPSPPALTAAPSASKVMYTDNLSTATTSSLPMLPQTHSASAIFPMYKNTRTSISMISPTSTTGPSTSSSPPPSASPTPTPAQCLLLPTKATNLSDTSSMTGLSSASPSNLYPVNMMAVPSMAARPATQVTHPIPAEPENPQSQIHQATPGNFSSVLAMHNLENLERIESNLLVRLDDENQQFLQEGVLEVQAVQQGATITSPSSINSRIRSMYTEIEKLQLEYGTAIAELSNVGYVANRLKHRLESILEDLRGAVKVYSDIGNDQQRHEQEAASLIQDLKIISAAAQAAQQAQQQRQIEQDVVRSSPATAISRSTPPPPPVSSQSTETQQHASTSTPVLISQATQRITCHMDRPATEAVILATSTTEQHTDHVMEVVPTDPMWDLQGQTLACATCGVSLFLLHGPHGHTVMELTLASSSDDQHMS
ncbi:hypothetical protein SeLEV6574_g06376 [Synchytrium endobioticum]|nr:hypothetical protein SeLEV6574_g06376 [Synchytrium endobioticum]